MPVPELLQDTLMVCDRDTFPNIFVLIKVAITIPVTTCENEISHSQLKVIKTSLRSEMSQKRLSGRSMMKIHRQQAGQLNIAALIVTFPAAVSSGRYRNGRPSSLRGPSGRGIGTDRDTGVDPAELAAEAPRGRRRFT